MHLLRRKKVVDIDVPADGVDEHIVRSEVEHDPVALVQLEEEQHEFV